MSPSPRALICTFGSPGDLAPYLSIGLELRNLGWSVTMGVPPVYLERVRATGLLVAPIRPDKAIGEPDPDLWDRFRAGNRSPGRLFAEMFLPGLRESWSDTLAAARSADLIVSHTLAFAAPIAAEHLGLPWVSGVVSPIAYFSRIDPPALGPAWAGPLLRSAGGLGAGAARAGMHALLRTWSGEWREIRREAGLPDLGDPVSAQHSPTLALGLFSPLLAGPQSDWPAAAMTTGFPFMRDPFQASLDPAIGAFLDAGPPPVVFTLGTTAVNEAGSFFAVSARAAADCGVRAVLLTGTRTENVPESLPDGVIAAPYAPFGLLFPRAAAIVHQGGIGTLAQAMRSGKPSLVMPYAHDQPDNAIRAERLGVARVIPRSCYRVEDVTAMLRVMLTDEALHRDAANVGQLVRMEEGGRVAALAIAGLAGTSR
jgi:UDP:flavonoid glycosyltransferase YjiC (YdhE family)